MKKTVIIIVVVAIICAAGGFVGGMFFGKSMRPSSQLARNFQGGNFVANGQGANGGQRAGNRNNANFVSGEIIAKDDRSITVKLVDGGSKIALFSASTEVGKFTTTTPTNLVVGENVMITGSINTDGSVTAKSIQLRPASQPVGGGMGAGFDPGSAPSSTPPSGVTGAPIPPNQQ